MKRFRGGLVFKAHRLLYHSALGLRVIKKKKKGLTRAALRAVARIQQPCARAGSRYLVVVHHALFLITYPYIAHCMGACSAKGEWSLFSLSLSSLASLPQTQPDLEVLEVGEDERELREGHSITPSS